LHERITTVTTVTTVTTAATTATTPTTITYSCDICTARFDLSRTQITEQEALHEKRAVCVEAAASAQLAFPVAITVPCDILKRREWCAVELILREHLESKPAFL
jgi:hypothetical protein